MINFAKYRLPFFIASLFLITLTGCKKEGCTDPAALNYDPMAQRNCCCEYATTGQLSFDVQSKYGNSDFEWGTVFYQSSGTPFKLDYTAFYFSNFTLLSDTGDVPVENSYVFFRGDSSRFELLNVPSGSYQGIRFLVGLDSATNYSTLPAQYEASHPLGPKVPIMHWSWNTGYIFLRFDGEVDTSLPADGTMDDGITFHIGTQPYLTTLTFNKSFEIAADGKTTIPIQIDYQEFFKGIDLRTEHVTHTSDYPDLTNKFYPNIKDAFSMP